MTNIYKVIVDAEKDYETWMQEAPNPSSAIRRVLGKVKYGKSAKWQKFDIAAELVAENTTYTQYKAARQGTQPTKENDNA